MLKGYLAFGLAGWPLGCTDAVIQGHLLQEGEAVGRGEEGRLQLTEVELHGTVVAHHVWVKDLVTQRFFADLEGHAHVFTVLSKGQFHLISIKVLIEQTKNNWKNTNLKRLKT